LINQNRIDQSQQMDHFINSIDLPADQDLFLIGTQCRTNIEPIRWSM